jgi:hypothetical protein
MREKASYESDPIVAERIREALQAPIEEPERVDLPKPKPVDEMQRWSLRPAPSHPKRKIVPR